MHALTIILILLAAVTSLSLAAKRVHLPYPTVMVLGGLAICFIPGLPRVELDPELFFVLFLPPLIYAAAWQTSWRDFHANLRPILQLAIGFVLFTTGAIAWLAHAFVPEMTWAAGFALGAIVSPPDAVAAVAIADRLGLPRRIVIILEGESLVNDATGLTLFRFAVVAAVTGVFSFWSASAWFLYALIGSVAIGLAMGFLVAQLHRLLDDPLTETVITLLTPYAVFILADGLRTSGVLAVVTAGLYVSRRSNKLFSPMLRMQALMVWETFVFVLNGLVFILIGLQLPVIVAQIHRDGTPPGRLAIYVVVICVATLAIRFAWVFPFAYLSRLLIPGLAKRDPLPPWQAVFVIAYTGMRGADSLAAALALPLLTASGSSFPRRNLIIFLTFCVILFTLVAQTLTLPWLIRVLKVGGEEEGHCEEWEARLWAAQAALERLEKIAAEPDVHRPTIARLRTRYGERVAMLTELTTHDATDNCTHPAASAQRLHREAIDAQRGLLIDLRNKGRIGDEVLRRIERDLDLEALRNGHHDFDLA